MITKITGEQPFQVLTNNFSISPSSEGYTLQISADGTNFSNLFTVGAGVTRLVTGVAANSYYRLSGNQSKVSINWMKTCVTEGGAAGNELTPVTEFPLNADPGTVVALASGDTVSVYQYDGENWNEVGGNTEDIELPIAAAVNDLKGNIETRLNQQYYKKAEVDNIAARKTEPGQVNVQIQDYVDPAIAEINDTIENKELATSAAINDLNTATVKSAVVKNIWSGTQSEYDAIVEKDQATLYIIKD
jgi:hypothetical protein